MSRYDLAARSRSPASAQLVTGEVRQFDELRALSEFTHHSPGDMCTLGEVQLEVVEGQASR